MLTKRNVDGISLTEIGQYFVGKFFLCDVDGDWIAAERFFLGYQIVV